MPRSQIIPQVEHQQQHQHQQQQPQQHHQQQQQQQLNQQVHHVITEASLRLHDNQQSPPGTSAARLNLNPDERLFYECCNILKSAKTPRLSSSTTAAAVTTSAQPTTSSALATTSVIVTAGRKQLHPPPPPASAPAPPSLSPQASPSLSLSLSHPASPSPAPPSSRTPPPHPFPASHGVERMPGEAAPTVCHQLVIQQLFRNPPAATPTTTPIRNHNRMSPSYSAISQFSATTSRFKTKAAMKGYENVNQQMDMVNLQLAKTGRGVCKLTELADIALGTEKPGGDFVPHLSQGIVPGTSAPIAAAAPSASHQKQQQPQPPLPHPHPHSEPTQTPTPTGTHTGTRTTTTPTPMPTPTRPVEQQSSTSSKTMMHASIIKASAGVASSATLPPACGRIIIPDRPFKNIGLEEKATIMFQKPKTCVNLLQEQDNNSVSTVSYSDRDDYDFGTLSCDGDMEPEQEPKPGARCVVRTEDAALVEVPPGAVERAVSSSSSSTSSPSSHDNTRSGSRSSSSSSRATAKTFENKSLIMGRIFKHASTKAASAVVATPVQQLPSPMEGPTLTKMKALPKNQANLDQIFDELRGGGAAKASEVESPVGMANWDRDHPQPHTHPHHQKEPMAAPAVPTVPAAMPAPSTLPRSRSKKAKTGPPANSPINIVKPPEASISASVSATGSTPSLSRKPRKDLSKLQSELGMSPEEIEQLIDEGQRKSKRRCATNRPKKLVETWSSDEYEEFLSTKDIIALIEEKEQQEQRRKRKTSEANANHLQPIWSPAASKKTPTPSVIARRKKSATKKKPPVPVPVPVSMPVPVLNRPKTATTARARQRANPNPRSDPAPEPPPKSKSKSKSKAPTKVKTPTAKSAGTSKRHGNDIESERDMLVESKTETSARTRSSRQQTKYRPPPPAGALEVPLGEDASQRQPKSQAQPFTMSPTQRTKSRSSSYSIAPPPPPPPAVPGARSSSSSTATTNSNNNNNNNSISSNKNLKTKRKSQTNRQSPPRRKRPASEKQLYYWSSSSDDEFGRVKADGEPDAAVLREQQKQGRQNPEPLAGKHFEESEQYQKHGWIVGDSHKKLVKLLAIAKGSKKVENCGVKRRTPKRKC